MDCRTVQAVKFRKKLGLNQHSPIMTHEQSVLTKLDINLILRLKKKYFNIMP